MNPNREELLFALVIERPIEKRTAFLDAIGGSNAVTMLWN